MRNKNVYFYIPGAESLNILYFLAEKHMTNLIVISQSVSVVEICNILGVRHVYPEFYILPVCKFDLNSKWKTLNNFIRFIENIYFKLRDLNCMIKVIFEVRKQISSIPKNSTIYYSTFFYDVPGIIFLGTATKRNDISVRLIWPNPVRFNKTVKPPLISETFILNILTSNLFTHHQHPIAGRIIGINPNYLALKELSFENDNFVTETILPNIYKEAAISKLKIKTNNRKRVIFLGEYSVEHGIRTYGKMYLQLIELLGKLDYLDVYYKPHPLYHSITHPALKGVTILDTQIPVEFLDDGSWAYFIAFFTAGLITKKKSKCICLLKLEELKKTSINIDESIKIMEKSSNEMIYPKSFHHFEELLKFE